jgi:c-di-GMP-related signal transduction protein
VDVLVARQAIFDRKRKLYGYELLYRSSRTSPSFDGADDGSATTQVLSNTLLSIGAENVFGGKKAFINFDHRLLAENLHLTLPRESTVIEILETVEPTLDLVALCRSIAEQGYTLALDDFTDEPSFEPLTRIARVIKVDMRLSSRQEQERMLRAYKPRGVLMLAEKVETHAEFEWARRAGYALFQGYFFARPVIVRGRQIPAVKIACLRLLREVHRPNLDFPRLEELLREDVALTYRLLRYVNSALLSRGVAIDSIGRALLVLGEDGFRRWVALATLPTLAANKPTELLTLALVRARFCERLAEIARATQHNQAFLMGMFSLLDALTDQPLEDALRSVDVGSEVTEALLGIAPEESFLARTYELIRSYEQGHWDHVEELWRKYGIPFLQIGRAYLDSTDWAEQVVHVGRD